jgi:hypothetical protein
MIFFTFPHGARRGKFGVVAGKPRDLFEEPRRIEQSRPTGNGQSVSLDAGLRSIGALAAEICGECVPRNHARVLKDSRIKFRTWRGESPEGEEIFASTFAW